MDRKLQLELRSTEVYSSKSKGHRSTFRTVWEPPTVQIEVIDGSPHLVLLGEMQEHTMLNHKGVPKRAYKRSARVTMSLATCEEMVKVLVASDVLPKVFKNHLL